MAAAALKISKSWRLWRSDKLSLSLSLSCHHDHDKKCSTLAHPKFALILGNPPFSCKTSIGMPNLNSFIKTWRHYIHGTSTCWVNCAPWSVKISRGTPTLENTSTSASATLCLDALQCYSFRISCSVVNQGKYIIICFLCL